MAPSANVHEDMAWSTAKHGLVIIAEGHIAEAEKYGKDADLPMPDRNGIMQLAWTKGKAEEEKMARSTAKYGLVIVVEEHIAKAEEYARNADLPMPDRNGILKLVQNEEGSK